MMILPNGDHSCEGCPSENKFRATSEQVSRLQATYDGVQKSLAVQRRLLHVLIGLWLTVAIFTVQSFFDRRHINNVLEAAAEIRESNVKRIGTLELRTDSISKATSDLVQRMGRLESRIR